MAVTKTHPIKSTLKAAIDYICNPEKTDGKLLVSSYGCAAETADIEFAWTRRHAIDKGTNLGRHLIQAFQPGEVTPEQAHEIGMELAKEILGGKYEFVLTTHIDKDHVHNHLIFNAVSFADHKHYHSNKRSYHYIRRTSDRLCKEHGLSVIIPGQDKGKSYIEHQATQNGISYKAKLKAAIDRLLPACSNLEELLRRLQREGYEIKRGKYISARAPDQERFTRLKTLGVDYTEEALAARIAGRSRPSRQPKQQNGKISLLIDIQNNIKLAEFVRHLDEVGVEWGITCDGDHDNRKTAELVQAFPKKFKGFIYVDPNKGEEAVRELEMCVKEYGLHALYLTAFRTKLNAADRKNYPLYSKACELGIPVHIYSSLNLSKAVPYDIGHPRYIDQVARDFPELKIMAGVSGWPWVLDFLCLAIRHENVYLNFETHAPEKIAMRGSGYEPYLYYGRLLGYEFSASANVDRPQQGFGLYVLK